jgi:hypothetical protein
MTTRRWITAVAVFAISLHIGMLLFRRLVEFRSQARFYAHAEKVALFRARNVASGAALLHGNTAEEKRRTVNQARQFAAYAARLKSKYERAAYLPFLPVEPDPPLP